MARSGAKRHTLTTRQRAALTALATAPTVEAAAEQAGVGRRTLHRWLKDPVFQRAQRELQRDVMSHATTRLQQAAGLAVDTLQAVMTDPMNPASSRVSAARTVLEAGLRAIELGDLAARVEELERALEAREAHHG